MLFGFATAERRSRSGSSRRAEVSGGDLPARLPGAGAEVGEWEATRPFVWVRGPLCG